MLTMYSSCVIITKGQKLPNSQDKMLVPHGIEGLRFTSVTWMHRAGSASLVLERFSNLSFLFLKLNFLSFFSSGSREL